MMLADMIQHIDELFDKAAQTDSGGDYRAAYKAAVEAYPLLHAALAAYQRSPADPAVSTAVERLRAWREDTQRNESLDLAASHQTELSQDAIVVVNALAASQAALRTAKEAIRRTREYVGEDMLPDQAGWSRADAVRAIDNALGESEPPRPAYYGGAPRLVR